MSGFKFCSAWAAMAIAGFVASSALSLAQSLVPNEKIGVRLAPGFRITEYADAALADDIYAMTLDNQGRVVVTSRGYIKTLIDNNHDGVADEAKLFAVTKTGGMGLCFDGPYLYFTGDGYLERYQDTNGDGVADGPPERLLPAASSEHGGHAIRKGPDGWWYFIGGNDSGFNDKDAALPNSPIRRPEAGCLLRLTPDGRQSEIIADGLRNPYDFDFNPAGEIFTYDSDVEADFLLPWYTPTRIFQIACGGHHGWRLNGWLRSWARPNYYPDTTDILAAIGRGSPTGVVCYRHRQFPAHYWNGLFLLDWTFGRIFFCPLLPDGATYQTDPELFLEPIGAQGFAPTDIAVAPDGALYVCIGGRKTRGAVYRIEYAEPQRLWTPRDRLRQVLDAPQPLDAWSRAQWMPLAKTLGKAPFWDAMVQPRFSPLERIRAIEILTELFGGLPGSRALLAARDPSPQVRARVAWSLGRTPIEDFGFILGLLADDAHPLVRRCALEAMADHFSELPLDLCLRPLPISLGYREKRVRLAAARLATLLPASAWKGVESKAAQRGPQAALTAVMVDLWRAERSPIDAMASCASILQGTGDPSLRLQAVRLIILALGDWHLHHPSLELYTGYEPSLPLPADPRLLERIAAVARADFPSGNDPLDIETSRLLAMIQDPSPATVAKVASLITDSSSPASDFHYLIVLSRLNGPWPEGLAGEAAAALLNLDKKLQGHQQRNKQNWNFRAQELAGALARRRPEFEFELLRQPNLAQADHLPLIAGLSDDAQMIAARAFLAAVQKDAQFPWSPALIELLGRLSPKTVNPLLRNRWNNLGLRGAILRRLALAPDETDADKFWQGLASSDPQLARLCLSTLGQLKADPPAPEHLIPLLRLLDRSLAEPAQRRWRIKLTLMINRQSPQRFSWREPLRPTASQLRDFYQPVFNWFAQAHPMLAKNLNGASDPETERVANLVRQPIWPAGDAQRGAALFSTKGCAACHAAPDALGPDLHGVTSRLSRGDLFTAILYPSRDIAPPYRPVTFQMSDGQTYSGLVAFESADGVLLETGPAQNVRLATAGIVSRKESDVSLMPSGLLAGAQPADLADLYAYLQSLDQSRAQRVKFQPQTSSSKTNSDL